jgi:hypothetical protein
MNENVPYTGYLQLTEEQMELADAVEFTDEFREAQQGWSVYVKHVPGLGYVTTGSDYGGFWDQLLCPPGVTTAAQVAEEHFRMLSTDD